MPTDSQDSLARPALLDPISRQSEIMFGLLMTLTFTGTASVTLGEGGTVRGILLAALGCNIAWGIVDGTMFLLTTATSRARAVGLLAVLRSASPTEARAVIRDVLPEEIGGTMTDAEALDMVRVLNRTTATADLRALRPVDFHSAVAVLALVIASTLPPSLPFILTDDVFTAMRWSNAIALLMLFAIGWRLDQHISGGSITMRIIVPLIGAILVVTTIALGG